MKIGIIGIGLIGGSLAIELKKTFKGVKVFGHDSSQTNLKLSFVVERAMWSDTDFEAFKP